MKKESILQKTGKTTGIIDFREPVTMPEKRSPKEMMPVRTYIDLGAVTPEAFAISERSREIARQALGDATPEDRIRQRCSIAVGDLTMASLLRFRHDPVPAVLAALARNALRSSGGTIAVKGCSALLENILKAKKNSGPTVIACLTLTISRKDFPVLK